ncbi:MAG TPA: hypothetical protein VFV38_15730, partial [Ktedonobacteraceae bacterium]|nr:hypothetical protein [Ktedonobacteraceae bacterium]
MLQYTTLFTTQIDPTGEKRTQVEQSIADRLFVYYRHSLDNNAFHLVVAVLDAFPPADLKSALSHSRMERVKINLVRWRQGLKKRDQPTKAEADQAGRELLLLILHLIYPDYVEAGSQEGQESNVTALDLALGYLEDMLSLEYYTGDDEIFETALEGTRLLKALGESSDYPHPYTVLPYVPSLLFPLKNAETAEQIWIEISPTVYGFSVNAHRRKPRTRDVATPSRETAMGGIHFDYYVAPQPMENPLTRRGTP